MEARGRAAVTLARRAAHSQLVYAAVLALVVAFVTWFLGGPLFEQKVHGQSVEHNPVRAALVVCALAALAAVIAAVNLVRVLRDKETLDLSISSAWNQFLAAVLAVAVGLLIGTTVFR